MKYPSPSPHLSLLSFVNLPPPLTPNTPYASGFCLEGCLSRPHSTINSRKTRILSAHSSLLPSPAPSSRAGQKLRHPPQPRTRVSEHPLSRHAPPGQHQGDRGPGRRRAPKRALRKGLGASSQRIWERNRDLLALGGSGIVYPKNLQGGVTCKGAGPGRRGPSPSTRAGGFPRPSTPGAPHPRGSRDHPRNCRQPRGGASAALLTRHPRHPGASLGELPALGLRLLGVEVLRLGLLAPRHGERSAAPGESLRVACLPQPLPGVRKLPPRSPGWSAHVLTILLLSRAGRFIKNPDG